MSIRIDTEEWRHNPWFQLHGPKWADYTGFYVGISIITIVLVSFVVINLIFCCCTPYKKYWRDPNSGNRLLWSVWVHSPKNQPPLTLQPELSQLSQEV